MQRRAVRHCPSTSPADRRRDASEKDGRTASTRRRLSSPSLQLKADRRPFTATKIMEDEATSRTSSISVRGSPERKGGAERDAVAARFHLKMVRQTEREGVRQSYHHCSLLV